MTLTELKYILAVAKERHFGRAAHHEGSVGGEVVHTLHVLAVAEEGDDAGHTLRRRSTCCADKENQLEQVIAGRSTDRLQDVHVLPTNTLLDLDRNLTIVEVTHVTISHSST